MICQALRSLLRARAFSVTVVLTVALGIGVNTAVFSVIYSVLLDPLPYRDPARLVPVAETPARRITVLLVNTRSHLPIPGG